MLFVEVVGVPYVKSLVEHTGEDFKFWKCTVFERFGSLVEIVLPIKFHDFKLVLPGVTPFW